MKGVGAMAMAVKILSPPKLCNWVRLFLFDAIPLHAFSKWPNTYTAKSLNKIRCDL